MSDLDWRRLGNAISVNWNEDEASKLLKRTIQRKKRGRLEAAVTGAVVVCISLVGWAWSNVAPIEQASKPTPGATPSRAPAKSHQDSVASGVTTAELQVPRTKIKAPPPTVARATMATAEELMRAAEEARAALDFGKAQTQLKQLLQHHRFSELAPIAAYNLGRYAFDHFGDMQAAAENFALSRALSPNGPLAEDALIHEVRARRNLGDEGAVEKLMSTYAERYPNGHFSKEILLK